VGTWIPDFMWESRENNSFPRNVPCCSRLEVLNFPFPLEASEVQRKCNLKILFFSKYSLVLSRTINHCSYKQRKKKQQGNITCVALFLYL